MSALSGARVATSSIACASSAPVSVTVTFCPSFQCSAGVWTAAFPAGLPDSVSRYVTALPTRSGPTTSGAGTTCAEPFAAMAQAAPTQIAATAQTRYVRKCMVMTTTTVPADAANCSGKRSCVLEASIPGKSHEDGRLGDVSVPSPSLSGLRAARL